VPSDGIHISLLTKPGKNIAFKVTEVAPDPSRLRANTPVPPLIESRDGDLEERRDIVDSPGSVFVGIENGS
jgi:hypothetical protein